MVDLASITGALATIFEDDIVSQYNRSVVLTQLLPFKEGTAKNLAWDPEFDGTNNAGAIAEGADVSAYSDDSIVAATLAWSNYSDAFSVSGMALSAAMAAANPAELENLFGEKLERAITRLTRKLNVDWYTGVGAGASPPTIHGLIATAGGLKATGTYAGLDRGTYTQWAGNELANGGVAREVNVDLMRAARVAIFNACGERPDLIICDATQQEKYGATQAGSRRLVQDVRLRGQAITLDGGYQALDFDGIPVVADPNCPAGKMLFLNSKYIRVRQLPRANIPMAMSQASVRLHGAAEEQLGQTATSLTASLQLLSVTGDAFKFQLILYPQIQVRRPNAHAVLSDLA